MKKFFLAICLLSFGSGLFALGLSASYFSPSGATVGFANGGDVFSFGYGLWIDSHTFTSTHNDYYSSSSYYGSYYSSSTTKTTTASTFDFGPYVQLDWAILPIKFNLGANQMAIGINTGFQVAALYSSYYSFDAALAGLLNTQIRYKNFDILLGYKPSLYFMEIMNGGSSLHSSFQIELRYYFGKRGFKKSSSSSTDSYNSPSDNTHTRVINGSSIIRT